MEEINAAGRALSQQRATQIAEVFRSIANLLIETGSADVQSLKEILDSLSLGSEMLLGAGQLEDVLEDNWEQSLWNLLEGFRCKFSELFEGFTPELRQPLVETLIAEFTIALTSHAQGYPEDTQPIQASAAKIPFQIKTSKRIKGKVLFSGVLARIDEVSEGIPAVGTGQPLFLPLSAAEKVVAQVKASPGMFPIDADISLAKHADENIIGVITDAHIEGQDLAVSGHLFSRNVPDQVDRLIRSRKPLGMSMNAMVSGYETQMGDRPVFYLENVDLEGANVLFADKATYQQTRFTPVAASEKSTSRLTPVAASNQPTVKDNNMDPLEEKLAKLEQVFVANQENFTTQLAASQAENIALKTRLEAIEAEKKQQEQIRQAQLAAAAKEAETQDLVDRVTAGVLKSFNPRRQVSSLISSTPLVPIAAQSQQTETDPTLKAIEDIDSQLRVLQANNSMGNTGALALIERKRELQLQMQMQGAY